MDILTHSALEISSALATKRISAHELMQATLARIAQVNGTVNAIVSMADPDDLLARARAADQTPGRGWLHGIPMAIKDLANAKGFPTSMGSPIFAGTMAKEDDILVRRLRDAGALIIGKTNTPEFGLGSHTFNPVFGATRNPYDPSRSAGGSSGGAAAALATGMLCVADGSDMMGSLRNPAGWNNVYGMRPSWGAIPSGGKGDLFMHQMATSGPMARTPGDLAALFDVMSGAEPGQPLMWDQPNAAPQLATPGRALSIGWLGDWDGAFPMEDGILSISENALIQMADLGHNVIPLAAPFDADDLWDSWCKLRTFASGSELISLYRYAKTRDRLKPTAQWEAQCAIGLSAHDVHQASVVRSDWYRRATRLFDEVDVLVLPSAQMWPFDVTLDYPKEIAGKQMDTYHRWMQVVTPAGLIGLPVVNVPVGFGDNGLPAGLQLIGPKGSDAMLLQMAQGWHEMTEWPCKRPALRS